jgi:hypothetical protein
MLLLPCGLVVGCHHFPNRFYVFFLMRTTPGIEDLLQPLEEAIAQEFIPAITGREVSDEIRELLALPPRLGGLGIVLPTLKSAEEFEASKAITKALVETIKTKQKTYDDNVIAQQKAMKREVRQKRNLKKKKEAEDMKLKLPQHMKRNIIMAQEKGASSWLNVIPLKEHGFALHKGDFRDVLCLRYDWSPPRLPSQCACGQGFTVTHAMDCPSGGFPSRRHNMIRDLTGEMLSEVCHGVAIEPTLQPLNGEHLSYATANRDDNARSDLCAQGFWGKGNQRAFFDIRVCNPNVQSYCNASLDAVYRRHEREKRRQYEERIIEVEMGSFTPLVFSIFGGMGKSATIAYKRLADLLSTKRKELYCIAAHPTWVG